MDEAAAFIKIADVEEMVVSFVTVDTSDLVLWGVLSNVMSIGVITFILYVVKKITLVCLFSVSVVANVGNIERQIPQIMLDLEFSKRQSHVCWSIGVNECQVSSLRDSCHMKRGKF